MKFYLLFVILLFSLSATCQNIISTSNDTIFVTIKESSIEKTKLDVSISPIKTEINPQNEEQKFISLTQDTKQKDNYHEALDNVGEIKNVFQANFDLVGILGSVDLSPSGFGRHNCGGPAIDAILGVRLRKFAFVGVGMSFQTAFINASGYSSTKQEMDMLLPLFANAKFYYPTKININPYLDINIGGYIGVFSKAAVHVESYEIMVYKDKLPNGFYFRVGAGLEIKRFNVGAGYQLCKPIVANPSHIGYVKVGIRVGKM